MRIYKYSDNVIGTFGDQTRAHTHTLRHYLHEVGTGYIRSATKLNRIAVDVDMCRVYVVYEHFCDVSHNFYSQWLRIFLQLG